MTPTEYRLPYVGAGADGARRSAEIDRSEADGFDPGEDRDRCLTSAEEWDRQARTIELETRAKLADRLDMIADDLGAMWGVWAAADCRGDLLAPDEFPFPAALEDHAANVRAAAERIRQRDEPATD